METNSIIRKIQYYKEINMYSFVLLSGREILEKKLNGKEKIYAQNKHKVIKYLTIFSSYNLTPDSYFEELMEALKSFCKSVWNVEMRLVTRGIIGMGESFGLLAFEVGLSFHPLFNVPYIPASSIKGAIRSACEELGYVNEAKKLFGDQRIAGIIGFTDAFPVKKEKYILYPDVTTPHYPNVETELEVNPNPVVHLSIAPRTVFRFLVYAKDHINQRLNYVLLTSMLYALSRGIGARTSNGYSLFEPSRIVKLEDESGG
ncbi:MAG: type III-B CRISPR module RAMP protein Cmr6 [Thermoprotei archaeon]|nr:MAG: type III-B CRISPR module RAMP protein Cmr6 [Thermoprotei archaeon]